jgi:hypothetical protein
MWEEYRELPGHVWCFSGLDACAVGALLGLPESLIPWAGVRLWMMPVPFTPLCLLMLPTLRDGAPTDGDTQMCVMSKLLEAWYPMGQIFATNLGADGFSSALDVMAPGLSDKLGYQHPWYCWVGAGEIWPRSLKDFHCDTWDVFTPWLHHRVNEEAHPEAIALVSMAFPSSSTYGMSVERSVYLWIARSRPRLSEKFGSHSAKSGTDEGRCWDHRWMTPAN